MNVFPKILKFDIVESQGYAHFLCIYFNPTEPWETDMRHKKYQAILAGLVLTLAGVTGCEWENDLYKEFVADDEIKICPYKIDENGNKIVDEDKELHHIETGNGDCLSNGEGCEGIDYESSFRLKICPKQFNCNIDGDTFFCSDCEVGQVRCNGLCLKLDDVNVYKCNEGDFVCKENFKDCNQKAADGCEINLKSDNKNCGSCGHACPSGQICSDGECTDSCKDDTTNCGGTCVRLGDVNATECNGTTLTCLDNYYDCNATVADGCEINLKTDNNNCGSCGEKCPDGKLCNDGNCDINCAYGFTECNGKCLNFDDLHLSDCNTCADSYCDIDDNKINGCEATLDSLNATVCTASTLTCDDSHDDCDGNIANGCEVSLMTDNNNCGECGNKCPDGQLCSNGECNINCAIGFTECNGKCLNFTDLHLSECDTCASNYCDIDNNKINGCEATLDSLNATKCAVDSLECMENHANCDKDITNGCEVDTTISNRYCGAKGTCSEVSQTSENYQGENCEKGYVCSGSSCGLSCQGGLTNCDGTCVDTDTSNAHCGGCSTPTDSRACAKGEVCSNGSCSLSCQDGLTNCNGICVDTKTSNTHCGGCSTPTDSRACAKGEVCYNGSCSLSCQDGLTNCGGTCVDTKTDNAHCGRCNNICKNGEKCSSSSCVISCPGSQKDCNNTCIETVAGKPASLEHCGACNSPCSTSNSNLGGNTKVASVECSTGVCKASACKIGYELSEGKCVDSSSTTCCGADCKNCNIYNNATSGYCEKGSCKANSCSTGYYLIQSNKTCAQNTAENCGLEGNNCNTLANTVIGICQSNGECAATKCINGYKPDTGSCVECSKGTFSDEGLSCRTCGDNQYTDAVGQASCKSCPTGASDSSNHTACTCNTSNSQMNSAKTACICKANYYGDGTTTCTKCPTNSTSTAGSTQKSDCKCNANAQLNSAGNACICKANYYGNGATCTACPTNATSSAGSTQKSDCSCGTNAELNGAGNACVCKANFYGNGSTCTECPANSTAPVGSTAISACTCNDANAEIVGNECKCKTGYIDNGSGCVENTTP